MNQDQLSGTDESRLLAVLDRVEIEESMAGQIALEGEPASDFLLAVAQGKVNAASPYQRRNAVFLLGLLKKESAVSGLANC